MMTAPLLQTSPPRPLPPLSPLRKAILVVGGLLSLGVITVATLSLVDWMGRTSYQRDDVLSTTGDRLVVRSSGDISIEPSPDREVHVHLAVRYGLFRPTLTQQPTSEGVTLRAQCRHGISMDSCSVSYTVQVPPSFRVVAESTEGEVSASRLAGDVRLSTLAGDIRATELSGHLTLRTGVGEVAASRLSSTDVEARSSAGDVTLTFAKAPLRVNASTGVGDVNVALPPGTTYRIDARSSPGTPQVDRTLHSTESDRTIVVQSSAGDVIVNPTVE